MKKKLIALAVILVSVLIAVAIALAGGDGGLEVAGFPLMLACAGLAFLVQWLIFVPSYIFQTEHYYDLTGSLTYLAVITLALLASSTTLAEAAPRSILLSAMVFIWALRLGPFLFRRVKRAGKDGRFDEIKPIWSRFLVTWTLQGLWVFVTLAAALAAITSSRAPGIDVWAIAGGLVWLAGLSIEAIADAQKTRFNQQTENAGKFINIGLWRWSRHPNYFGEIVLWLGVAIVAIPSLQGWQWVTMISPLFVVVLLTRISGVPLLEKRADDKWGGQLDYEQYKANTPVLVMRPPAR
jgi:steroid 5-alpha reductase family enzyme